MNGRVYDYNVGRFLGVDPFLQFPENSQSANPYSYIMNNPMSGTDPTGYSAETDKEEAISSSTELKATVSSCAGSAQKTCNQSGQGSYAVNISAGGSNNNKGGGARPLVQNVGKVEGVGKGGTNVGGMSGSQALEVMGGVIKDHWKDILRGTIQSTRETSPVADVLVDFAGAEDIVEGSINMAEGNIKAGVQAVGVAVLGKIKVLRGALDKISTGRTEPKSLHEKLAMDEVMSNPSGVTKPRIPKMSDTKNNLLHKDGWRKRVQNVNDVEIHYVENINTKQVIDFKFKD